jgi:hypothetical protein
MKTLTDAMSKAISGVPARRQEAAKPPAPLMPIALAERVLLRPQSAALAGAMQLAVMAEAGPTRYAGGDGDVLVMPAAVVVVTPVAAGEARERLAALEAMAAQRPEASVMVDWLLTLAELVERAPGGDALAREVQVLARHLDLPAMLFTEANAKVLAAELIYWPKFAKLEVAMRRLLKPLEAEASRLARVVAAGARPATRPEPAVTRPKPTPEQAEANRRVVEEMQRAADPAPPRRPKVGKVKPLTPAQTAEMRRQLQAKRQGGAA